MKTDTQYYDDEGVTQQEIQPKYTEHPKTRQSRLTDSQKEAIIGFIDYLIDHLTLRRLILLGVLGICGLVLFSVYEHRSTIVQHAISYIMASSIDRTPNNITDWELSEVSRQSIQEFTKANPVLFTSVTEVNLMRNTKKVHYTVLAKQFSDENSTTRINNEVQVVHTIFDYDPKNTAQMVSVLANEFRCDPFQDTIYHKVIPKAGEHIGTICRVAIPPFVGKFIGFLSIGLPHTISKPELDSIRLELSRVAVEIYLRDIEKK